MIHLDTLKLWCDTSGYSNVDELGLKVLVDDLAYRTRELISIAINHMSHCRRHNLKVNDIDRAFELYGVERAFGYSDQESFKYEQSSENKFKVAYANVQLQLSTEKISLNEVSMPPIDAKWTIVNGIRINHEDDDAIHDEIIPQLDTEYEAYYNLLIGTILKDDCEDLFERFLIDLRNNNKLQPIFPYLIRYINQMVLYLTNFNDNTTFSDYCIKIHYLKRFIDVLSNIILNQNLFMAPKGYFSKVLSCILYLILHETFITQKYTQDLVIRDSASLVLAFFFNSNENYSMNSLQYIKNSYFISNLIKINDSCVNLSIIYGILCSLFYLGPKHIEDLYSHVIALSQYLSRFEHELNERRASCETLCLRCLHLYYKWKTRELPCNYDTLLRIYNEIYDLFGDHFVNMIGESFEQKNEIKQFECNRALSRRGRLRIKSIEKSIAQTDGLSMNQIFVDYKQLVNRSKITFKI